MSASARSSILLYGNCQAEAIAHIAHFLPSLRDKIRFKVIPLHIVTKQDWQTRYSPEWFADIRVLWNQVESGEPTEHRSMLESRLPPDCQVVRFPPYNMLCLWPFSGSDPRIAVEVGYRYPWADSIAASLADEDLSDDALFDKYMEISSARMPDLERRLRMDVARWRITDKLADIQVADWVLETFRAKELFYTAGHLTALPLGRMLKLLLEQTGLLSEREIFQARLETDFLLRHNVGQDLEIAPLHPLVAERLGIGYYDPDALYRWHGHEWTYREYILKYIRWEPFLE
jgi:hypothetical protein